MTGDVGGTIVVSESAPAEPVLTVRPPFYGRRHFLSRFVPVMSLAVVGIVAQVAAGTAALPFERLVTLDGVGGSKIEYLEDAVVKERLLRHHIALRLTRLGSRESARPVVGCRLLLSVGTAHSRAGDPAQAGGPGVLVPAPRVEAGIGVDDKRVLLYPNVTFQSEPTLIALNEEAQQLAQYLATDPVLRRRALELGYRPLLDQSLSESSEELPRFLAERGVPAPSMSTSYTRAVLPDAPTLEAMITTVGDCPP